jgi:hypothetical protein
LTNRLSSGVNPEKKDNRLLPITVALPWLGSAEILFKTSLISIIHSIIQLTKKVPSRYSQVLSAERRFNTCEELEKPQKTM